MEIDIEIDDLKTFAGVAFILDQDKLLNSFIEIRQCWRLNKGLIPYDKYHSWRESYHDFPLSSHAASILYEAKDNLGDDPSKEREIAYLDPVEFEAEQLLKRLGISPSLYDLILRALVCGEVRNEDLNESEISKKNFKYGDWLYTVSNIYLPLESAYKGDTKQEIKRDREWYWLRKSGAKLLQIATGTPYRGAIDPRAFVDNVKKQIKRYKAFLNSGGHLASP
ncbi:MAG: hypothetical protein A3C30_03475 [Candidatus Levybacteria bacterium RIFCSPHIGHO2_02_FULL_40_18]|uniref:Uncharacterized protein n=1 Tax=Candidatus Woesebacteria bacterium RIFCSPLOWO2_01_FULL_39_25 TaxID=1802521 RepID=A0A1F8BMH0_9BACT|nr:MAG: hypothetical protein A3C30_03475 [Candidatus Levybacteria bacterium RIFCSPHIGHO2_02_FULL_40_18]OGH31401.1 MAG: hypothetical protein A3E43_03445 [Candidatus Levybacteria bacterium RIFCSPHIGHO2_12_FULL_40_31]OGM65243.1 MAG: hypothetical protein A2893_00610 [Candidatus Woesebacteria bacterium RIFCSPLOWO2_01_FULL_39_25]